MNAPRIRTLPFALVLLTALLLACASTGPPFYWNAFTPTYSNFKRHFDERGEDLDAIEGIWSPQPTQELQSPGLVLGDFVIVRDSSYEAYEFVGVRKRLGIIISQRGPSVVPLEDRPPGVNVTEVEFKTKGEVFITLRRVEGAPGVYEYTDAAVLRGEKCLDEPCHGVYVITAEGILLRQRFAIDVYQQEPGWVRRYPLP
jgi:hypothetical protein